MRSDLNDQLHDAIRRGNLRQVKALLKAGADINYVPPEGWTPLMMAAELERFAVVRLLLDSGADVNLADRQGLTPLHRAVLTAMDGTVPGDEPTELIMLFLERGASVSAVDDEGMTPLDWAARYVSEKIYRLLSSWEERRKSQQGTAPSAGSADTPPKSVIARPGGTRITLEDGRVFGTTSEIFDFILQIVVVELHGRPDSLPTLAEWLLGQRCCIQGPGVGYLDLRELSPRAAREFRDAFIAAYDATDLMQVVDYLRRPLILLRDMWKSIDRGEPPEALTSPFWLLKPPRDSHRGPGW